MRISHLRIRIVDPTGRTPVELARRWQVHLDADGEASDVRLCFESRHEEVEVGNRASHESPHPPSLDFLVTVAPALSDEVTELVRACWYLPLGTFTVARAADALGIPRRTLSSHLKRSHAPAPHLVIDACRLLRLAYQLSDGRVTVEAAALGHGFGSSANLRRMLRHLFGVQPRNLRGADGWRLARERFANFVAPGA